MEQFDQFRMGIGKYCYSENWYSCADHVVWCQATRSM